MKKVDSSQLLQQRLQGLFFGLALGDAMGAPVEFLSLAEIRDQYPDMGIQTPPAKAQITDDTQLTLALADALVSVGLQASLDTLMKQFAKNLMHAMTLPTAQYMGITTRTAIQNLNAGMPWQESGIVTSKGCGCAMRVAPVGAMFAHDDLRLREVAIASSLITHGHPTALASTVAAAYLIKLALTDVPTNQYLSSVLKFTEDLSDDLHYALLKTGHVLGWGSTERSIKHLGEGWVAEEAVALALYCVLKHPDNYSKAVRLAANIDGDSDTVASITGGIMGARLGIKEIPRKWIASLTIQDELNNIADKMAQVLLA